ncbi:phage baseplate assembly protein V [Enterobacteriaceae bacterium LUAb1]
MNNITLNIAGRVYPLTLRRLRIMQQINSVPSAHLELSIPTDNHDVSDSQAQAATARFVTGSEVIIARNKKTLFSGYLTRKRWSLRGEQCLVQLEAHHILQKLMFFPRSRIFRQKTDITIISTLFQQAGIEMKHKATQQQDVEHNQMVQFRVSDWQFILSRLFATNYWLLPDAASGSVTIAPLAVPPTASHTLKHHAGHSEYSVYEIDLNFDNRFTSSDLSLQGWDIAQQQLSRAQKSDSDTFTPWKATVAQAASPVQERTYQLAFSHMPETAMNTFSRSWMNYQQLTGVQGRIVLEGTDDFHPGESVTLSRFGSGLEGTAVLTGINQLFDMADGWRTELLVGLPPHFPDAVPAVQSLHIATAADFTADPQDFDRIPVSLPALNLPGEFIFARLGKPWASKGSGFCFYPEPGDELVVGFIESDPRYPVILGALHNPKNRTPVSPDKKNHLKGLVVNKSDTTQQLLMNTEEKNVTFSVGEVVCRLDAEGNILLDAPETLTFSAKSVSGNASDKLSLSGDKLAEITSQNITMKKS